MIRLEKKRAKYTIKGNGYFGKAMCLCVDNVEYVVIAPSLHHLADIKKRIWPKETCELITERTSDVIMCGKANIVEEE